MKLVKFPDRVNSGAVVKGGSEANRMTHRPSQVAIRLSVVLLICAALFPGVAAHGEDGLIHISISVGGAVFDAQLYDTAPSRALVEQMPLTLKMADYAQQEKVAALPFALPPAGTEKPDTMHAGELYLWSGNQLVLFYTTFANSYGGYVRLGAIADTKGLVEALGSGDVTVTMRPAGLPATGR